MAQSKRESIALQDVLLNIALVLRHGQALEVINGRPRPGDKDTLWRLVRERDLQVSVGSDFHRDSPYGAGLGVDVTEIPEGMGVWEQL